MKYICLGFSDTEKWEGMSEQDRDNYVDRCFTYDEEIVEKGHYIGGEALDSPLNATTVRFRDGKPWITDGPYVESKEQLGGILILEARDLNEAIRIISNHPGITAGGFEIRPAADLSAMIAASRERRSSAAA